MLRACLLAIPLLALPATAADPPKPRDDLISDFVDNTPKYKGKTVTFTMALDSPGDSLRDRVGDKSIPFLAVDPNNGAKLPLGLDIPKGLEVPNAKSGEVVIVTFKCGSGANDKGNTAVSITRPVKAKK